MKKCIVSKLQREIQEHSMLAKAAMVFEYANSKSIRAHHLKKMNKKIKKLGRINPSALITI